MTAVTGAAQSRGEVEQVGLDVVLDAGPQDLRGAGVGCRAQHERERVEALGVRGGTAGQGGGHVGGATLRVDGGTVRSVI